MSAADEAWQERVLQKGDVVTTDSPKAAFMAGYRRALEDATEEIQNLADAVPRTATDPNAYARMVAYDYTVERLRARAAAVAPRETKD